MLFVFGGRRSGRHRQLQLAVQDRLRAGEPVIEIRPTGAARLQLDDVGGIHRFPLTPHLGPWLR